ncbi:thioredoxin domain-containing protein [Myxococcota bacterium]
MKKRKRDDWLLVVIVAIAGTGAWYSWNQQRASPVEPLDLQTGRPKLIQLGMGVCAQCKRMKPVMEQAGKELGASIEVRVLDVRNEASERVAERYQMGVMPLGLLIGGTGRELWRHEGYIGFDSLHAEVIARLPE